ncbi:hypothetical protein P7K49_028773, partial [Saguinus oedipus]
MRAFPQKQMWTASPFQALPSSSSSKSPWGWGGAGMLTEKSHSCLPFPSLASPSLRSARHGK